MADEVRQILFEFVSDVRDITTGAESVKQGMGDAAGGMDVATKAAGTLKAAAISAGVAAAGLAADWALAGIDMAVTAGKIEDNFDAVLGESAGMLSDEIEDLASHMGLADHEAQQLLANTAQLGQTMGMTQEESAKFAEDIFRLSGDMARFNPEAGTAADAMEAITKASNGSTRGLQAWGVSLKNSEINARALAMTGKATTAELTQEEKALATLALTTEKMSEAQGQLSEDMASGATEVADAKAEIDNMQVAVGEALMPIRKLALEGLLVLADVLIALEPAIKAVGEILDAVMTIITPLIDIVAGLARIIAGALSAAVSGILKLLEPLIGLLTKAAEMFGRFTDKVRNFKMPSFSLPSFHSGGTVPGAAGTQQMIMAQGGEQVVPRGGRGGGASRGGDGGGGTVVNITVQAGLSDPQAVARQVADLLVEYTAVNGPVDIKTTGGS